MQYYYQVEKKAFFSKGKHRKYTKRWQDHLHMIEVNNWDLSTLKFIHCMVYILYDDLNYMILVIDIQLL